MPLSSYSESDGQEVTLGLTLATFYKGGLSKKVRASGLSLSMEVMGKTQRRSSTQSLQE